MYMYAHTSRFWRGFTKNTSFSSAPVFKSFLLHRLFWCFLNSCNYKAERQFSLLDPKIGETFISNPCNVDGFKRLFKES